MLYPLMFVVNPFFNWLYMVYGIFTAYERTWGGPRADAVTANEQVTPEQAVAKAIASGDELNIKPETFRSNAESRPPLLPSDSLDGRFAPAEEVSGGFYRQVNRASNARHTTTPREQEGMVSSVSGRDRSQDSYSSEWSSRDSRNSLAMPRRVESIVGPEITAAYHQRQMQQRPAGGAFFESGLYDTEVELRAELGKRSVSLERPRQAAARAVSVESSRTEDSVEMHFAPVERPTLPAYGLPPTSIAPVARQPTTSKDTSPARTSSPDGYMALPAPTHQPARRSASAVRIGKSPLTRKSFTRLATDDAPATAGSATEVEVRVPRRASIDEESTRGRRRRTSVGVDGRRRLSKQPRSSRSNSRA